MTIKREAAFHEAGHAVAVYRSRFYKVAGPINLEQYGAGSIDVGLNKNKLKSNGKPADKSAILDKEVNTDLAVILCAGLVAERIAERRIDGIKANPKCAKPDHEFLRIKLKEAGLSQKIDGYEKDAERLLEQEWNLVMALTNYLLEMTYIYPDELHNFIKEFLQRPNTITPIQTVEQPYYNRRFISYFKGLISYVRNLIHD
jgi:hypothetical protein